MPIEYEKRALITSDERLSLVTRMLDDRFRCEPRRMQRRVVFDVRPGDELIWGRLRDDGDVTVLTIKEVLDDGFVNETETGVDDWETGLRLITVLGFTVRSYQENLRQVFSHVDYQAEVMIDEWPRLGTVVEVEADSAEELAEVQELLELEHLSTDSITQLYRAQGIDVMHVERLAFEEEP